MGPPFESLSQLPRPFGPFTLVRLIAQGGMGQVFLALRPVGDEPDEVCVVKTVRADLKDDREAVGRFLDEARVVQKLDHDAICHTLDAGIVDKSYYLALEFISGRNLRDVQTRAQKLGKEMPETVIYHALTEILDALEYAHALIDPATNAPMRIVHRDVSPHNVMLGFDGAAKLIDFGLAAHELKREMTRPGIMVGKLRYNAPEQVRDRAWDGRSDLYSVGVMLYELLVGERFYEGLSEEEIWRVAMKGTHRPRGLSSVAGDVRAVLDVALAPRPEDRFRNAGEMRDAVDELVQSRRLRELRRASSRFMSDIFAEEREAERDMILQATGLAEARTHVFAIPALDEPTRGSGEHQRLLSGDQPLSEQSMSVGRTQVVSPAKLRGRLAELVSGFDPNAETAFGDRAYLLNGEVSAARGAGSDSDAFTNRMFVGDARAAEDSVGATVPIALTPASPRAAATKVLPGGAPTPPPLRRPMGTSGRSSSPAPWLFAAGFAIVAIFIIVVALALRATSAPERPTTSGDAPSGAATAGTGAPPAGSADGDSDAAGDATDGDVASPPPSPATNDEPRLVDKRPRNDKQKPRKSERPERSDKTDKPAAPKPVADAPPRELRTLKEQVDYLKAYCLERVSCARPATSAADKLITLSPTETKALMQEIPKCIQRCQR